MPKEIVISGLGAMGGYYGGMLAAFTEKLTSFRTHFFMRNNVNCKAVQANGLHIKTPSLDFIAHPATVHYDAKEFPQADYLILATKGYDLKQNIKQLSSIITPKTIIVTTQNGLAVPETLHELFPKNIIAPAACHITGRRSAPGLIEIRSDFNLLKMGMAPWLNKSISKTDKELIESLFILLRAAGVKCNMYDDMGPLLREKFIMLSPSAAATTYFDVPIGIVLEQHNKEIRALVHELASLYHAMGYDSSLFIEEDAYEAINKMPKEATTSMHSDIAAGHKSELELLVGYVVTLAKKYRVEVPYYTEYYQAIKQRIKNK